MRTNVERESRLGSRFAALRTATEGEADFIQQHSSQHPKVSFLNLDNDHSASVALSSRISKDPKGPPCVRVSRKNITKQFPLILSSNTGERGTHQTPLMIRVMTITRGSVSSTPLILPPKSASTRSSKRSGKEFYRWNLRSPQSSHRWGLESYLVLIFKSQDTVRGERRAGIFMTPQQSKQRGSGAPPHLEKKKSQKKCAVDPLDDTTLPLAIDPHHRANALGPPPESFIRTPTRTRGGKEDQKVGAKVLAKEAKGKEAGRALPNAWSHNSHNNHPFPPKGTPTHVYACLPPPSAQSPSAHSITGFQPTAQLLIALIFVSMCTAPTFSNNGGALCITAEKTPNVADIDSKHCYSKHHTRATISNQQQQHTRNQQRNRKSINNSRATTVIIILFRWVPTRGRPKFLFGEPPK